MCAMVKLRYCGNMCFLYMIMGMHEEAISMFRDIKSIIIGADHTQEAL